MSYCQGCADLRRELEELKEVGKQAAELLRVPQNTRGRLVDHCRDAVAADLQRRVSK